MAASVSDPTHQWFILRVGDSSVVPETPVPSATHPLMRQRLVSQLSSCPFIVTFRTKLCPGIRGGGVYCLQPFHPAIPSV
ncbi:hypothetical protein GDO78_005734 [Eleutherodactylus coqui]|uniref:Uncharacterized protein n=1 Tax=Eleutherodactylus coqui TaxID=57060 RepID=A0A8J6FL30_ELECQ|nr:hypothetical protein GDO78_005734 [Eleutherodactylus coqui]